MRDAITDRLSAFITAASRRLKRSRPAAVRRRNRAVVYGVSAGLLMGRAAKALGGLVTLSRPASGRFAVALLFARAASIMLAWNWLQRVADDDF